MNLKNKQTEHIAIKPILKGVYKNTIVHLYQNKPSTAQKCKKNPVKETQNNKVKFQTLKD